MYPIYLQLISRLPLRAFLAFLTFDRGLLLPGRSMSMVSLGKNTPQKDTYIS